MIDILCRKGAIILSREKADNAPRCGRDVIRFYPQEEQDAWEEQNRLWKLGMQRRDWLYDQLDGDTVAITALELCAAVFLFPELGRALTEATGKPGITVELAYQIEYGWDFVFDYKAMSQTAKRLGEFLKIDRSVQPFMCAPMWADRRLMGYLSADDSIDMLLDEFSELFFPEDELPPVFANQQIADRIAVYLDRFGHGKVLPFLQITGKQGTGKRFLLKVAGQKTGIGFVFVDYRMLKSNTREQIWEMTDSIKREAYFYRMGVCFYHVPNAEEDPAAFDLFVHLCIDSMKDFGQPVCVCTETAYPLISKVDGYVEMICLKEYTRLERVSLWEGFWRIHKLRTEMNPMVYATKYKLSARDIEKTVMQLSEWENAGVEIDASAVSRASYNALPPSAAGNLRLVEVGYRFDDLKLPVEQKNIIKHICGHVLYHHRVFDEWDMERKYVYGKGITVLFTGPPGTGKTMAANVMSSMLEIALYRIDLSQVVDKYIGETEKRLEEIFTIAERSNIILFFDEADAIFGKRSEVKDAKDKYANTEVSYILQRIEQYDGIVLLATNNRHNIDDAFLRRIRYVVDFPLPSKEIRKEIWQSCFSDSIPVENIDFDYLAKQYEIAGGIIKNVVLAAAFYAAAENSPVNMRHILSAVKAEQGKRGKIMSQQDFGDYWHLMSP